MSAVLEPVVDARVKMMVVDDSNVIRGKISRAIDQENIDLIGTAKNGREAIVLFAKEKPKLVTMDLTMPEMDGIECIGQIVKLRADVLILVISALNDKAIAIEALKLGAHGFLCKPFSEDELNDAIKELIQGARNG
ncbi:MAG TPA: response regulator [Burkholderiales bacterium]|jgi:two-component system, chemotaxis family, chemotaxis protein CheY|nr:response regulator [Burkholderiales bacterium]